MNKNLKPDGLKFVDVALPFAKLDYEQLIVAGEGEVTVSSASEEAGAYVEFRRFTLVKDIPGEVDIVGCDLFIKVEGATNALLGDKRDVKDVFNRELEPQPLQPVTYLDDKKI